MKTALLFCNKEYLASGIKIRYCSGISLEGPRKTSYGYPAFISALPNILGVSCCLSEWGSDCLSSFHRDWTKPQQEISSNNRREKRDFLLLKLINNPPYSVPHRTLICTRHSPCFKVVTKHILTPWLIWTVLN